MSEPKDDNLAKFTIRADKRKLLDALHKMKGDTNPLGARIVQSLLDGDVRFSDIIEMGFYGISMTPKETDKNEGS